MPVETVAGLLARRRGALLLTPVGGAAESSVVAGCWRGSGRGEADETGLTRRGLVEPDCAKVAAVNIRMTPPVMTKRVMDLVFMNIQAFHCSRQVFRARFGAQMIWPAPPCDAAMRDRVRFYFMRHRERNPNEDFARRTGNQYAQLTVRHAMLSGNSVVGIFDIAINRSFPYAFASAYTSISSASRISQSFIRSLSFPIRVLAEF